MELHSHLIGGGPRFDALEPLYDQATCPDRRFGKGDLETKMAATRLDKAACPSLHKVVI